MEGPSTCLIVVGILTQGRFGDQVHAPDIASHALQLLKWWGIFLKIHLSRSNLQRVENAKPTL
jgi:uncharacterized NAD(P)/FAD-binding protein YdhS